MLQAGELVWHSVLACSAKNKSFYKPPHGAAPMQNWLTTSTRGENPQVLHRQREFALTLQIHDLDVMILENEQTISRLWSKIVLPGYPLTIIECCSAPHHACHPEICNWS
jgi:hypothetical protein